MKMKMKTSTYRNLYIYIPDIYMSLLEMHVVDESVAGSRSTRRYIRCTMKQDE